MYLFGTNMADIRKEVLKLVAIKHDVGYPVQFVYNGFAITSILAHIYTVRTESTNVEIGKYNLNELIEFLEST